MRIDVIGCGSAFAKNSNTSSLLLDDHWLIDCGPTVPRALFRRNVGADQIQAIYFTHIHPDHCAGVSALINNWKSFGRREPLTIFCQKEQQSALEFLVSFANWPSSELGFEIHWQEIIDSFQWNNWTIETADTQHEMPNKALAITTDGYKLFYSGDGRPTKQSIQLMRNADLAFQECASFQSLSDDSSHGDFFGCIELLAITQVKQLGLYHCWEEDLSDIKQQAGKIDKLFVSQDDLVIDLPQR
ncbi:MBL fold metallo-hydrolase [Vibrio gazogenes]|uniref:Ribonuclease BN, tRNA processing enzyme n=1 Tax=Vibrio gazogenes DSM 21264 = NBRC 103151 TaxID=1123492 RepID=A0A1M5G0C4_VIBGA|nr:ribonuclease Z [Vibrio gazogenes]USP14721.1 ribonuclease Z [Vibrio gazogenes]SHF97173.1 Ribonuclease BN, tRNA processing enzyme [Vibrio gazogenes DSM 21264] [Vibrio gazogenes DSM 21264 = NBRC 103151]